jgi:hypothetical protein
MANREVLKDSENFNEPIKGMKTLTYESLLVLKHLEANRNKWKSLTASLRKKINEKKEVIRVEPPIF